MRNPNRSTAIAAAVAMPLLLLGGLASAQAAATKFPERPVRWIVPFPAGGSIDLVGRIVGQHLTEVWGQQVVVDNRPGAGGRVGTQVALHATADGYNQLLTLNTNYTVDHSLFKHLGYDPRKAFVPITILASTSQLLVVTPSLPVHNVKELIALCKAKPGQINYGSSGVGGSLHLAMELFKSMAGIDITHVAYKGGPPAAADLMAGRISLMFFNTPAALRFVKTGKLRPIAVSTGKRSDLLPNVPTVAESGVPGFNTSVWYGLSVPRGTPHDRVEETYHAVAQVLAMPDVRARLDKLGADVVGTTPAQTAQRIKSESAKWAKVIAEAHISVK